MKPIKEVFEKLDKLISKVATISGNVPFETWHKAVKECESQILQKEQELLKKIESLEARIEESKLIDEENQQLEKWKVSPSVNDLTDKLIEKEKEIEKLNEENKQLNIEKLNLIRLRKFVEEANNPNSWCINCGHAIDEHGGETLDDLNHCCACQEEGTDCNDFKPCEYIGQIIHKRELKLKNQLKEQKKKIETFGKSFIKTIEIIKKRNPYPSDIFREPTKEQYKIFNKKLEEVGLIPDNYNGTTSRDVWNNCCDDIIEELKSLLESESKEDDEE